MEEALISRGRRSPPDAGDRPKRRRTVTAKAPVQTRASTRGRGRTATTRRQGPLRGSGTLRNHLSQEREPKATSPHHVVQPAVVESRVWCSECEAEALPGAPCHSEHAVVGLQRMVDQVAMDLRAQQDAVCRELPRFRECLELMRFRARAAEERQDVAALRAEAAAQAACFEGLEQRLRKFVEDARRCWAEASVPETRRADEEAVSHLRLSAVKSEPVDEGQLFGSVELHLELKQEQDEQDEVNGASTSSVDDMDRLMEAEPPLMLSAVKSEPLDEGQLFDSVTTHDEVKQEHVDEASILSMPYTVGLRIFAPDECLDVIEETKREKYSQDLEDFLQDPGLDKVKWLDGVYCLDRPSWCVSLLKRVAPRVEWLYLFEALTEHLHVVHEMPALRYLHVHLAYKDENDPDLPVQLEELTVENVSTKHFKSVQRMPRLRKLSLDWSDDIVDVESPPLPAHHRGLQWLWVSLRPCSTVLSLAKAHAATLQELRILCASHGDTPWHFRDLAAGLRDCGLVALRRIVLLRRLRADEPDDAIPHHVKPCQQQKKNIRVQLLASGLTPKIFCEECDVAPKFPELGDFTWKNS